jgi:hypothetical protein
VKHDQPLTHDRLPLPDYERLPVSSLEDRIRSLDLDQVAALLVFEQGHGQRPAAVRALERRLEEIEQDPPRR